MKNQKQKIIETYRKKDNVEIFDEERSKYLFQKHKHKVEADFLKKALREIKKDKRRVLDVGCGTGRMLAEVFSVGALSWMEAMAGGVPKIIGNNESEGYLYPIDKIENYKDIEAAIINSKKRDYRKWLEKNGLTWKNHVSKLIKVFERK